MYKVNATKILFYCSSKKINSKGEAPIYCRITLSGKRTEISTAIFVQPKFFKNGEIVSNNPILKLYKKQLEIIKYDLVEVETILKIKGQTANPQTIKQIYINGFKESNATFSFVAEEWLKKQAQLIDIDFSFMAYRRRDTTIQSFTKFLHSINKSALVISDLKESIISDFVLYSFNKNKLSRGTIRRKVQIINSIVNYAVIHDYSPKNYISQYRVKAPKNLGEIKSLSIEQLKVITETKFSAMALNYVRDCFLFQCYTGLAFSDVSNFSLQNISKDTNGKLWLIIHRQKTNTKSTIPLITEALQIIAKYEDLSHKADTNIKNNGLLPVYCNQVYNRLLKEIGLICNIQTELMSSHTARKTFAMVTLNSGGISIETVSKMLGHSKISMTQQYYAYVDTKKIANEMQNFSFTNLINN